MASGGLERVRRLVLADPALQERLLGQGSRAGFVATVVEVAREHGLVVTGADVDEALLEARRSWRERWI